MTAKKKQSTWWDRSLRFTFSYKGRDLAVIRLERLKMVPPGSQRPAPKRGMSGYWCELQGPKGAVLYYRILSNPIQSHPEVFPSAKGEDLTRIDEDFVQGTFDLVVPDDPTAECVVLFGSPPGPGSMGKPAIEWGRFAVK